MIIVFAIRSYIEADHVFLIGCLSGQVRLIQERINTDAPLFSLRLN